MIENEFALISWFSNRVTNPRKKTQPHYFVDTLSLNEFWTKRIFQRSFISLIRVIMTIFMFSKIKPHLRGSHFVVENIQQVVTNGRLPAFQKGNVDILRRSKREIPKKWGNFCHWLLVRVGSPMLRKASCHIQLPSETM